MRTAYKREAKSSVTDVGIVRASTSNNLVIFYVFILIRKNDKKVWTVKFDDFFLVRIPNTTRTELIKCSHTKRSQVSRSSSILYSRSKADLIIQSLPSFHHQSKRNPLYTINRKEIMPITADETADTCRCMMYACFCCYSAW